MLLWIAHLSPIFVLFNLVFSGDVFVSPHRMAAARCQNKQTGEYLPFTTGTDVYVSCVWVWRWEVTAGSAQIPQQHRGRWSTTRQWGRLLLGLLLLSKRRSYLSWSVGRGSIYHGQTLAHYMASGDSGRSLPATNQSTDWEGETLSLIKNTQMNNLSLLTACVWLTPVASTLFILYLFPVWSLGYRNIYWRRNELFGSVLLLCLPGSDSSSEIVFACSITLL